MKHTTSYIGEKIEGTSHENNNATSEKISSHCGTLYACRVHTRGRQMNLPSLFNALFSPGVLLVIASGYYTL